MTIEKAILSAKEPKETNTAWVQPKGDSLQLNIFNNGKWRPIAGGGSSGSSTTLPEKWPVDPDAIMLSPYTEIFDLVNGYGINPEDQEAVINFFKTNKFGTSTSGNATFTGSDFDGVFEIYFTCDDGTEIVLNAEEGANGFKQVLPDYIRYIIVAIPDKTLPQRNKPRMRATGGGNTPSVPKLVWVVKDVKTGEIMDPVDLHFLTDTIWKRVDNFYCEPYRLNKVISYLDEEVLSDSPISHWVNIEADYTVNPGTVMYINDVIANYDYTLTIKERVIPFDKVTEIKL